MKNLIIKATICILSFTLLLCGCSAESDSVTETSNFSSAEKQTQTSIPNNNSNAVESFDETTATTLETTPTEIGIRDESLEGRGNSDSGRSEPQYVGHIGYIVASRHFSSADSEDYLDSVWVVPTYEKDKQFYNEVGTVEHKTEVLVLSQELEHEGFGRYSGYLEVEKLNDRTQYCIDVSNFVVKPYWTYENIEDAVTVGAFVAEYTQSSDYYPVNKNNEKVELSDGHKILVVGKTGTYGKGGPDNDTNQIEAIVYKEWQYGYGGVPVFFNVEDLKIIY